MLTTTLPRPAVAPAAHIEGLHRHLTQCRQAQGRWFGAALMAERVHGWVAPRLVTTVAVVSAVLALSLGWL